MENYQGEASVVDIEQDAASLLTKAHFTISLAESCTGGLISYRLTSISGSSAFFESCVVAYANKVKRDILGVSAEILERYGAVSEPVARGMSEGVRRINNADIGLSVTGIAGPSGGSSQKPVGTVFISLAFAGGTACRGYLFTGDRSSIRWQASQKALEWICEHCRFQLSLANND
ncbi:MAG: CinA family protein [Pseudomonadota bacterium]